jgi:Putative lipoprotein LpqV
VCWRRHRPPRWATLVLAIGLTGSAGVTACSHGAPTGKPTPSSSARSSAAPNAAPPGAVGLSPTGVTTRVDVPADSTEEEYFQACHAAKVWMDAQPKTGGSLLEPYLAMIQESQTGSAGTWNARWSELTLPRQAAVITAARAAAGDECG